MEKVTTFDFSVALNLLKEGKKLSRNGFNGRCHVEAQFPDADSKMTQPYLFLVKKIEGHSLIYEKFPIDLSCEAIFADDWFEVLD